MKFTKSTVVIGFGVVVAAVVTAVSLHRQSIRSASTDAPPTVARFSVSTAGDSIKEIPEKSAPVLVSRTEKEESAWMRYRQSFAKTRNYWVFAHEILPAAKSGDANAQFYLSRLMEQCADGNRMYFQNHGAAITLDEGLQYAVRRHLPIEIAQSIFDKCHDFMEHDSTELGNAKDWLAKATDAGQPLAQVTTATKIFMQELMQNYAKTGGVLEANAVPQVDNAEDPRQLLRAAVESRDAEVLFNIGEVQGFLQPAGIDNSASRLAWLLVACERGFDCSSNADWIKNSCASNPDCASIGSPTDIVRIFAGDSWPSVQQRALDINNKIEAGKWDDLGIGS